MIKFCETSSPNMNIYSHWMSTKVLVSIETVCHFFSVSERLVGIGSPIWCNFQQLLRGISVLQVWRILSSFLCLFRLFSDIKRVQYWTRKVFLAHSTVKWRRGLWLITHRLVGLLAMNYTFLLFICRKDEVGVVPSTGCLAGGRGW